MTTFKKIVSWGVRVVGVIPAAVTAFIMWDRSIFDRVWKWTWA